VHFDFTVGLGQVAIVTALVTLIWRIEVFSSWLLLEHEMLIEWYCQQHSLKPSDLMTRKMRRGLLGVLKGPKP
jgi:hypothetical protein